MRPLAILMLASLPGGCATLLDGRQADPPPPGIARVETLVVDGLPERLLIRGRDPARNPVLLFLHGGPGFPAALFSRVNVEMERDFTVVHWDQRGAGHSYRRDLPPETLRVETFVRETLAVTRFLRERFKQRKIYLVGHSWGTLPGALAVARAPEWFHAYIGVGQIVNIPESERVLSRSALSRAQAMTPDGAAPPPAARELRAYGPPAPHDLAGQDRVNGLLNSLRPRVQQEATTMRLAALAATSRYYGLGDLLFRVMPGYHFSRQRLNPQIFRYDLRRDVPRLRAPALFVLGRYDSTVGAEVAAEYYRGLIDPAGKRFVLFEESTHWPHLEEPARFAAVLRHLRAEVEKSEGGETRRRGD